MSTAMGLGTVLTGRLSLCPAGCQGPRGFLPQFLLDASSLLWLPLPLVEGPSPSLPTPCFRGSRIQAAPSAPEAGLSENSSPGKAFYLPKAKQPWQQDRRRHCPAGGSSSVLERRGTRACDPGERGHGKSTRENFDDTISASFPPEVIKGNKRPQAR